MLNQLAESHPAVGGLSLRRNGASCVNRVRTAGIPAEHSRPGAYGELFVHRDLAIG